LHRRTQPGGFPFGRECQAEFLPPAQSEIFDALSKSAIACADAVEAAGEKPMPTEVRKAILLLQVAITDLAATLKTCAKLTV